MSETTGYLGIDAGTQGLSVLFVNERMDVLTIGSGSYDMVAGLAPDCYEQQPADWIKALKEAIHDVHRQLAVAGITPKIQAIGISGQMHGEVMTDEEGDPLGSVRLWCDARNESEGHELTERFGVKVPKRATIARFLWTMRNQSDRAVRAKHLTTPAGWIAQQLTGEWNLGIGDASGMFPIDPQTLDYDTTMMSKWKSRLQTDITMSVKELLPQVRCAGDDGGKLNARGAELLGLRPGIPVAPAEGDQPAALAGSLIGEAGWVSVCFGTSVCANSVADRSFVGVDRGVDHFCAADGKPINMVFLRNGTTFVNTVLEMFASATGLGREAGFARFIPELLQSPADCGGLLALPFMDDEPGMGVSRGGTASIVGWNRENARVGNVLRAALLSTMFNLRLGSQILDEQGFPRTRLVLSGGLTKSPALGQLLADVYDRPVSLLTSAEEGTAWGAALLAKYRHQCLSGSVDDWCRFLAKHATGAPTEFAPQKANVEVYREMYARYLQLL